MALTPKLRNELKRAQLSVNPKYVTIEKAASPEQEGMGLILRVTVRGICSRGVENLKQDPIPVDSYRFKVYVPANAYDADAPSPISVRFEGVMPYSLHVFPSGRFCFGSTHPAPPLHVVVKKVLLGCVFSPEVMNFRDRANSDTTDWIHAHQHEFPYFPPELLFNRAIPGDPAVTSSDSSRPTVRRA